MSRVRPLRDDELGELSEVFKPTLAVLGFVPNSQRTMAHKPELLRAFAGLVRAIFSTSEGSISPELRTMVSIASSLAAGCMYCVAHTGATGKIVGMDDDRIAALWDFEKSELFSEAERSALRFAQAASAVPNMVTDADFADLRQFYTDFQVVEIVGVISMFGFLNRWNDTMATALEEEPIEFAERLLKDRGWDGGKHVRAVGGGAE